MKKLGLVLMSVGAGAIGLLQAKDSLPKPISDHLPSGAFTIYTGIGLAIFVVGALALVGDVIVSRLQAIKVPRRFLCGSARTSDVSEVHAFATALLGPGLSGINQMKAWLRRCERAIVLVHSEHRANGKRTKMIAGYFCLLPLTDAAAASIASGNLSGKDIRDTDLTTNDCKVIYLGGVAAKGTMARGVVVGALQHELERHRRMWPAANVYTRPINSDGLRLATTYGFSHKHGGGQPRLMELAEASLAEVLASE